MRNADSYGLVYFWIAGAACCTNSSPRIPGTSIFSLFSGPHLGLCITALGSSADIAVAAGLHDAQNIASDVLFDVGLRYHVSGLRICLTLKLCDFLRLSSRSRVLC